MQHFRAPTRLLDWTFSPYVAAYFAVEKNWDEDGAIWFFDSLSTHIHTGGFFRMRDVNRPKTVSGPITFQMTPNWEETEVSGSFTYFRVLTNSYGFERLVAQQGLFTISAYILDDHEDVLQGVIDRFGNNDNRIVGKMRMPHTLKPEFLRQLREMNISANALFPGMDDTVFPSMDGIGRSMTELVRSRVISTPQDRGSPPSPSGTEK